MDINIHSRKIKHANIYKVGTVIVGGCSNDQLHAMLEMLGEGGSLIWTKPGFKPNLVVWYNYKSYLGMLLKDLGFDSLIAKYHHNLNNFY